MSPISGCCPCCDPHRLRCHRRRVPKGPSRRGAPEHRVSERLQPGPLVIRVVRSPRGGRSAQGSTQPRRSTPRVASALRWSAPGLALRVHPTAWPAVSASRPTLWIFTVSPPGLTRRVARSPAVYMKIYGERARRSTSEGPPHVPTDTLLLMAGQSCDLALTCSCHATYCMEDRRGVGDDAQLRRRSQLAR